MSNIILPHLPEIPVIGMRRYLAHVRRRREDGSVHEINTPRTSEEILLLAFPRIVENCGKID